MREIEYLTEDCTKLQQMLDIALTLRLLLIYFSTSMPFKIFIWRQTSKLLFFSWHRCPHQHLEENVRDLQKDLQRQLNDRQSNDSQLCVLELAVNQSWVHQIEKFVFFSEKLIVRFSLYLSLSPIKRGTQVQHMTVVFPKSEKRTHWEKMFNDVKLKITAALDHHPIPEFIGKYINRYGNRMKICNSH